MVIFLANPTPPTMATKRMGGGVSGEFANTPTVVVELPPAPTVAKTQTTTVATPLVVAAAWPPPPEPHKNHPTPALVSPPPSAPIAHPRQASPSQPLRRQPNRLVTAASLWGTSDLTTRHRLLHFAWADVGPSSELHKGTLALHSDSHFTTRRRILYIPWTHIGCALYE